MELEVEDFIRKLDAGELDGKVTEALSALTEDQLQAIGEHLVKRSSMQRPEDGKRPHDAESAP